MKDIGKYGISIIIPCKNESINIKQTLDFLLRTEAKYISDIIVIDDGSDDNCCGFIGRMQELYPNVTLVQAKGIGSAQARNIAAEMAERAEFLVFCDAHVTVEKGWLNYLLTAFDNKDVSVICPGIGSFDPRSSAGYGQSWGKNLDVIWLKKPSDIEEIPLAPGGCMIVRKSAFDAVGGFDRDFRSWGYEDVELSLKLWLFGYKLYVHPGVRIGHKFRKFQPYDVDMTEFSYNKLRMALSHFNMDRYQKVLALMDHIPDFEKVIRRLDESDAMKQRTDYFGRRTYDDSWFFNKFHISF